MTHFSPASGGKAAMCLRPCMAPPEWTSRSGAGTGVGVKLCMERGVLCLTAKDKVRLLPALNIPMEDLTFAVETILTAAKELGGNI